PENKGFETRSATNVLTAAGGTERITCAASTSTGEITGAKTVGKVLVVFTGCTSAGLGGEGCTVQSSGATKAGEIRTAVLKGELGTVAAAEAPSERVLVIRPETGKRFALIEENACTEEAAVTGSIAGEIERIGIRSVKNGLLFRVVNGKQAIKRVKTAAGELKPELSAFGTVVTESSSQEWEFREAIEIT
ncbi:MAG: hypothetical protein ABR992_11900, partial [Solirubrobacteraceae bacterium]